MKKAMIRQKNIKKLLIISLLNFILIKAAYAQPPPLNPEYLGFIQQKISSSLIYPTEAKVSGWGGIVKVRFTVARDGHIKEIDIAESSGYPLLDSATISAIKDASPYPFPKDYFEEELEILLPVNYGQPRPSTAPYSLELPVEVKETLALPGVAKEAPAVSTQELTGFIDLALINNKPTKVAREEIEFAQIKVDEAQRNVFPAFKISSYFTEGFANAEYEEQEIKLEFNQPIYYGNRLIDTIDQAGANLEISRMNYDRLRLDVIHKTETSYYNLVAAKIHLHLKEELRQEAKEMLEKIERLYSIGMAIPLEVSSATNWYEQIKFHIDSIKQDLFMAEITLKQVLNIKETPKVKALALEAERLDLDLESCLEIALENRPEIYLSQLLVKFNEYGQRIKESEERDFAIDLITSYGFYQGRYKTEPWKDSHNWYAGIKVSKPWEGSTLNASFTTEESEPRYGQTAPTESSTVSAEFSLLDNLRSLSDKKRSDIDLHRAMSDFDESLKTITFEVQDAFLNYQKAILQFETAKAEMKFRRNEAEVTKVRAMVGEANLSSAMQSLYVLSEAQTKYIQALANYSISLANLKKATGYGITI